MAIVSAFLVPGNPLPVLRPDNPPWQPIIDGFTAARQSLQASRPDVILMYSTQWIAVLDQLWQTRPRMQGIHVDENWHEFGELEFDLSSDTEFAGACVNGCGDTGVRARAVDYDGFPVDTGTIVANHFLNPCGKIPLVIGSNNVYHDATTTEKIAWIAANCGDQISRKVAVVAVGELSSAYFDYHIDIADDRICNEDDDKGNRTLLEGLVSAGCSDDVREAIGAYIGQVGSDMGMKHLSWLLGAVPNLRKATIHGYGPFYGAGGAVVEFAV